MIVILKCESEGTDHMIVRIDMRKGVLCYCYLNGVKEVSNG